MSETRSPAGARPATISDVAREAGTGKTSVSRYLNGETNVLSADLRTRIEAAIQRLNYRPNQMARGLKRGRNRLLGLLAADLTNPYTVEVLQGVEAACHALGYMPLICHAANEADMERRYLQLLTTYRVEGMIVNALGAREDALMPLRGCGIPTVLVDRRVEGFDADLVGLDNSAAVRAGLAHLFAQGFAEVCFVVQPFEQVSSRRLREAAFRAALAELGRDREAAPTIVADLADCEALAVALAGLDARLDAAASAGRRVALFAANAPVALALARHLHARHGAGWQARVALLSIDDPEWAELLGITTIRQPTYEIGYRAVEFVHDRIDGATDAAREALLPGELVVRTSTAS
ncbi:MULTISPECIES: LacI family DNA-binding transcriptional regulator [Burkholderia]|uniref:LacI family DNA-binding transcriptional regulator n=1 Tax=Burkholderia TaxID=32008 RepID=UPI000BBD2649|nr:MULTISPECIES: LacI family DNA-binding transcriptional regulator [Burkholderia]ATF84111.1 LacI family transcriptional regulator [Burkholderia gladioli pv. gladioli]MBJ9710020.1 LacI family DNA-binding transcriptional regulator [Burkholderia gladioli]MBU9154629.1 LacI family DNA-binding transcriptional regulator [Burkholderia gladioli]MBU9172203.1 LacI family DNA-binding transcriptional regulator [Burkholderia gladioli]MBU9384439.1 LacI family DNA-binding transcriptional regulator [Burkholder